MHPVLFHLGPVSISSYAFCVAAAFLAAFLYSSRQCDRRGLDRVRITNLQLVILIAGLAGSHFLAVLLHWSLYSLSLISALAFWVPGGRVYYGGLILATVAGLAYCRRAGLPAGLCADIAAPSVALAQTIGRVGCFLAGCCYGRPGELSWCLAVPVYSGGPLVPRHPTQLYEAAAMLVVFAILHRYLASHRRADGVVLALYATLYGPVRFVVEAFRDDYRGDWALGSLTPSQWLSVATMAVGLVAFLALRRMTPRAGTASP